MYSREKLAELSESIRENGVISPILVRPLASGGYEIVSGHNRVEACKLSGIETIPAIVRDMDDDTAILVMIDANQQRETVLPSEKAFAYKMRLEAMKRQGKRYKWDRRNLPLLQMLECKARKGLQKESCPEGCDRICRSQIYC